MPISTDLYTLSEFPSSGDGHAIAETSQTIAYISRRILVTDRLAVVLYQPPGLDCRG